MIAKKSELDRTEKQKQLKITLDSLLEEVNAVKGGFDLDKIFISQSTALLDAGVFSLVTLFDKKDRTVTIKGFTCRKNKSDNVSPRENIGRILPLDQCSRYNLVLKNKKPVFCEDSLGHLATIWPKINKIIKKNEKCNSLILPLLSQGEVVGFWEIFSKELNRGDTKVFADFFKKFVIRISNILLFQQTKNSEKRYRNLFEKSHEGFVVFNARQKKIIDVNSKFCRLSGYRKKEIADIDFLKLFPEKETGRVKRFIRSIEQQERKKSATPKEIEISMTTKKGNLSHVIIKLIQIVRKNEWFILVRDITEKTKAKQALKESEERFRGLVDNMTEAVVVVSTEGFITFANNAFHKVFGYTKKEIKENHFSQMIYTEDYNFVVEHFNNKLKGKEEPLALEMRMIDKKGSVRQILCSCGLIKDKGRAVGIQAILRDITQEKLMFQEVENSKKHYEEVIDTIQDGICVINRNNEIESHNKAFAIRTGFSFKGVKGRKCFEVLPRYEKYLFKNHCRRENCRKKCQVEKVLESGKGLSFVEKNKDKKGKTYYHQISIYPAHNRVHGVDKAVMTIKNVTDKTMAEESVRRLSEFNKRILDNVPVSIMVIDKKGNITATNKYIKFVAKHSDYVGKNIFKIPFFKEQGIKKNYRKLLKEGKAFAKENCLTIDWAGKIKYLNIIAVPLKSKKGKIEGAISMALDNTVAIQSKQRVEKMNTELEKVVTERTWQLNKLNKELEKVLELKSKFITDASHELRTPLTVVQGNLDLAVNQALAEKNGVPDVFKTIEKEIRQISNILSDLTMLTNADAKAEKIEHKNVDVGLLVNEVAESLMVLAKKKKIKIKVELNNSTSSVVKGDEMKLERVFINIIRNAIKYTPNGGAIKIWLEKGANGICTVIKDSGIGIPQEDLPYIFERFYRVDKARSRDEGGTGLGLSICDLIIKAHNGSISVESLPGKGSKFTVFLPFDYKTRDTKRLISNRLFEDKEIFVEK